MKTARWCGIFCLSFFLWLLLFPPWMELSELSYSDHIGERLNAYTSSLGHHWRFSVPYHWEWFQSDQQSFFVPNLDARIDYRQMLYEAVIGLVALALLFLLHPALEMAIRKFTACAKVEIILMGTRIRNWRHRDRKSSIAGVRQ